MDFCEKCGALIIMKDNKVSCAGCGYSPKKKLQIKASEKINAKQSIAVIKKDEDVRPQVSIKCPICKNKKAYHWAMQTRGSDESETKFYECVKCKHTWRVYR